MLPILLVCLAAFAAPRAAAPLNNSLDRQPDDSLQIGADEGSQLLGRAKPRFTGLIESVGICSGVAPFQP